MASEADHPPGQFACRGALKLVLALEVADGLYSLLEVCEHRVEILGGVHRSSSRGRWIKMAMLTVYSKPDCHLCAEAMSVLRRLQGELGFVLQELDITADDSLHRAYFERIPVVAIDGEELLQYFVDEAVVRERLESRR